MVHSEFVELQRGVQLLRSENNESIQDLRADMQRNSYANKVSERAKGIRPKQKRASPISRIANMENHSEISAEVTAIQSLCQTSDQHTQTSLPWNSNVELDPEPKGTLRQDRYASCTPFTSAEDETTEEYIERNIVSRGCSILETKMTPKCSDIRQIIINRHWRFLGAWLSIVAYHEEDYQAYPIASTFKSSQKQSILEINLISRALSSQLRFTYGDFSGANGLCMSLNIPKVISEHDSIFLAIEKGDLEMLICHLRTGAYRPNDVTHKGVTLLGVRPQFLNSSILISPINRPLLTFPFQYAALSNQAGVYTFLIDQGAKVDACWMCSDALMCLSNLLLTGEPISADMFRILRSQLRKRDVEVIMRELATNSM